VEVLLPPSVAGFADFLLRDKKSAKETRACGVLVRCSNDRDWHRYGNLTG
jgi:hypothetical protein